MNDAVDPTFRFMTLDWDGKIRMDPSSPYAMRGLIDLKDRFDLAFACDTDHDRHGIVTQSAGCCLRTTTSRRRSAISSRIGRAGAPDAGVGKTVVSSAMIDRVAAKLGRPLVRDAGRFQVVRGRPARRVAGLRRGGKRRGVVPAPATARVWSTDKDGIVLALLAAEMTARMGRDPGEIYRGLTREFGDPQYERIEAPATPAGKAALQRLSPEPSARRSWPASRSRRS